MIYMMVVPLRVFEAEYTIIHSHFCFSIVRDEIRRRCPRVAADSCALGPEPWTEPAAGASTRDTHLEKPSELISTY